MTKQMDPTRRKQARHAQKAKMKRRRRQTGLIVTAVILAVAAPSLILPFIFKNGSEKGRMAYLIVFGTLFALVAAGGVVLEKLGVVMVPTEIPMGAISVAAAVVLYPASWVLSVHWYGNREL